MRYHNPVISGFYPDPSVCEWEGKYYLVASSFQYFPGVPLFESEDLVNWNQIGHVLTRPSQVALADVPSSGGVFAPTIRCHQGRFYMVTTNDTTHENFYVWTDDIHGEWSDPVHIDQGGIDPSLLFDEDGKVYFTSNGVADNGEHGITQCQIDIRTGKKLTPSRHLWRGTGGRFIEAPHLYHIGDWYYLMAAEGGTEYGHMETLARSKSPWGPFESCPWNPILTNRNKAPYRIQAIGHGDLVRYKDGSWHIISLGIRTISPWENFHHLGREVFLTPVDFTPDGWLTCGRGDSLGTTDFEYDFPGDFTQKPLPETTFANTRWDIDWAYLRSPSKMDYRMDNEQLSLSGTDVTLSDSKGKPTFIALRQRDFAGDISVDLTLFTPGEAGVTLYMSEAEHFDLFLRKAGRQVQAVLSLNAGGIHHEETIIPLSSNHATLVIHAFTRLYAFGVKYDSTDTHELYMGFANSKLLSTELAGGFTGVMIGLYAVRAEATFEHFRVAYKPEEE